MAPLYIVENVWPGRQGCHLSMLYRKSVKEGMGGTSLYCRECLTGIEGSHEIRSRWGSEARW